MVAIWAQTCLGCKNPREFYTEVKHYEPSTFKKMAPSEFSKLRIIKFFKNPLTFWKTDTVPTAPSEDDLTAQKPDLFISPKSQQLLDRYRQNLDQFKVRQDKIGDQLRTQTLGRRPYYHDDHNPSILRTERLYPTADLEKCKQEQYDYQYNIRPLKRTHSETSLQSINFTGPELYISPRNGYKI